MKTVIEYFNINSPWSFMGHHRLLSVLENFSFTLELRPVNAAQVFSQTGGVPVPQRHPTRQKYRLSELKRWDQRLKLNLNIEPAFFPSSDILAHSCILRMPTAAKKLEAAYKIGQALWCHEANIADPQTMSEIMLTCEPNFTLPDEEEQTQFASIIEEYGHDAVSQGVFGMPTFLIDGELFWGQDRLDFVFEKLSAE